MDDSTIDTYVKTAQVTSRDQFDTLLDTHIRLYKSTTQNEESEHVGFIVTSLLLLAMIHKDTPTLGAAFDTAAKALTDVIMPVKG